MPIDPDTPRDAARPPRNPEHRSDDDQEQENPPRTRQQIVAVAIMVVLIGAGIWLAHVMADARRLQDCLFSGRTNCAPVDVDSGR